MSRRECIILIELFNINIKKLMQMVGTMVKQGNDANGRDHDREIVEKGNNRCIIKVLIVGLGKTSCKIAKN
jgi:hypothetical protein